ncbi:MAG: aminopeptidase [Nitrososphaeria archaeon]|jgi:leucyl aminopeptidase (aminopeptidase T)
MEIPYRSLRIADMMDVSRDILERICLVKPKEKVVIIGDLTSSLNIIESLAGACEYIGAEPIVMIIKNPPYPGKYDIPSPVLGAIREADCTIQTTTNSMAHTEASELAMIKTATRPNGGVWVSMNGVTETNLIKGGIKATGTNRLKKITQKATYAITGKTCKITSKMGTNLTFELSGKTFSLWGESTQRPVYHMIPDGESGNAPVPDSVNGTVVVDGIQEGVIPLRWPYDGPIKYELKDGRVTKIYGSTAARIFKKLIFDIGDEGAKYIGEFAVGTNPEAIITGALQEDKHVLGTIHLSLGDGLVNRSILHLDGVQLEPTVEIDGRVIIDEGEPIFLK